MQSSVESLLPDGLADETLTTLALLFPSSHSSKGLYSSTVPFWLRKGAVLSPEHDKFLHAIRTSPLEPYERDIRNFHYWHDRIVILKQAFDEAPPIHNFAQLWHDRRDSLQWYTFWAVALFGMLTVCLSIVQVLFAALQYRNSSRILYIIVDREGYTDPPFARSVSDGEERSDHKLSPGEIAGVTLGGLAIIMLLAALSAWLLMRRRSQSTRALVKTKEVQQASLSYHRESVEMATTPLVDIVRV